MLLLDRGSTTPPVFVKLRGELKEEGGGKGDGEESDGSVSSDALQKSWPVRCVA